MRKNYLAGKIQVLIVLFCLVLAFILVPNTNLNTDSGNTEMTHQEESLPQEADSTTLKDTSFEVHFIDVGQADAALVICDGHMMLIDGGNVGDSSHIYAYLKEHNAKYLDYMICTHAHEDHVGGLSGALNYAKVGSAFCPVDSYDTKAFNDFIKYLNKQGLAPIKPKPGLELELGSAKIYFLAPQKDYSNTNDTSIVVRIVYGKTSFLFTGDAERNSELDMLAAGCELDSTLLKVGHHGSNSSTIYPFLREVMPKYAVISVGKDNPYGHPTDDLLSRLRDADVEIYRTDMHGTVIAKSDGENVSIVTSKKPSGSVFQAGNLVTAIPSSKTGSATSETAETAEKIETSAKTGQPEPEELKYIGNKNSKAFHLPKCEALPKEKNRVYFDTRDQAVQAGFKPCGNCKP